MAKEDVTLQFRLLNQLGDGLKKISGELLDIGKSALKVTGIVGGLSAAFGAFKGGQLLTGSIAAAGDLEQVLARLSAATGASGAELTAFQDQIILAAQASKRSTLEAAQTVEVLARAGLDAKDAIAALPATLNLATAANLSAADAANLLADTLDQFALQGSDAARVADVIAQGAIRGGTGVDQLTDALRKSAPAAKEAKLTLEDTVAAIGALAKQGIEGGRAGKGLEAVLQALADPASKFRDELRKLGISSTDFGTVLGQLEGKGKSTQGALEALSSNGKFVLQALLTEGGASLRALTKELENSDGASAKAAERINTTFNAALKNLSDRFEDLRVAFLGPILEPLTAQLDALGKKLIEFTKSDAFKGLQDGFVRFVESSAKAIGEFITNLDFNAVAASVRKFASEAKLVLEDVVTIVRGLKGAVDLLKGAWDGLTADDGMFGLDKAIRKGKEAEERANALAASLLQLGTAGAKAGLGVEKVGDSSDLATRFVRALTSASGLFREAADGAARAIGPLIQGVEGTQRQFQGATSESGKLVQKLNELNASLIEQAKAGIASGLSVKDLQDKLAGTVAEINETEQALAALGERGNITGGQLGAGIDIAARAAARLAAEAQNAKRQVEEVGDAAKEASNATQTGAATVSGALSSFIGLFNALNAEFAQESEAARKLFIQFEEGTVRVATGIFDAFKRLVRAGDAARSAVENQKDSLQDLVANFDQLGQSGEAAFRQAGAGARFTAEQLRALAEQTRNSTQSFDLLNRARLDELASSIDAAAARVQALEDKVRSAVDQIRSMGDALEDELDRQAGNEEEVIQRQIERERRRLRELAEVAGAEGRAELARAQSLLDRKLQAELAAIRIRREAEREAREERERDERRDAGRDRGQGGGTQAGGGGGIERSGGSAGLPTTIVNHHYHIAGVVGDLEDVERKLEKARKLNASRRR